MSGGFSAEEKIFKLRDKLESFIKDPNVPEEKEARKKHYFLVSKAFSYICELDVVEDLMEALYFDSFTLATHHQVDALMSKHQHVFYHCGKFTKLVEIIVGEKHHLFVAVAPFSQFQMA